MSSTLISCGIQRLVQHHRLRIRRQENHSAVCGYVWPANGLCQVQGRYHGRAGQGDPLDRVYARRLLIVITCEEDKRQFTVLTVQPRVPTGKYALEELPAGMLDMSGSFVGAAAKELQEETGIIVNEKGLIDLTEKAFKGTAYNHVYPSAGGCDEILRLFLYQVINQSDMFCDHVCFVRAWKSRPARPALVHIGGACCHLSRKHIPKFIAEKISPYWCM